MAFACPCAQGPAQRTFWLALARGSSCAPSLLPLEDPWKRWRTLGSAGGPLETLGAPISRFVTYEETRLKALTDENEFLLSHATALERGGNPAGGGPHGCLSVNGVRPPSWAGSRGLRGPRLLGRHLGSTLEVPMGASLANVADRSPTKELAQADLEAEGAADKAAAEPAAAASSGSSSGAAATAATAATTAAPQARGPGALDTGGLGQHQHQHQRQHQPAPPPAPAPARRPQHSGPGPPRPSAFGARPLAPGLRP